MASGKQKERRIPANWQNAGERLKKNVNRSTAPEMQSTPAISGRIPTSRTPTPADILPLQRLLGNRAVRNILARRGDESAASVMNRVVAPEAQVQRLIKSSDSYLQRDAEAEAVHQRSELMIDEFAFPSTVAVVNFDTGNSPAIRKSLDTRSNESVSVPPGSSGTVSIRSRYWWRAHRTNMWLPVPKAGNGEAEATARFIVSPEGKFQFTDKEAQISQSGEAQQPFVSNAKGMLNSGDGSFGAIGLDVDLVASTGRTSTTSQAKGMTEGSENSLEGGFSVEEVGFKGSHKGTQGTSDTKTVSEATTTSAVTQMKGSWGITLRVPPIPPPSVGPTLTMDVLFATNSAVPKADQASNLQAWFLTLPKEAKEGLKSGKYKISLLGQASPTGDSQYNIKLTAQRNQSVAKLLRQVEPGVKISEESFTNAGFLLSKNPPKTESAGDKAVHIRIEPNAG